MPKLALNIISLNLLFKQIFKEISRSEGSKHW